jgi:hypothetical protein
VAAVAAEQAEAARPEAVRPEEPAEAAA